MMVIHGYRTVIHLITGVRRIQITHTIIWASELQEIRYIDLITSETKKIVIYEKSSTNHDKEMDTNYLEINKLLIYK